MGIVRRYRLVSLTLVVIAALAVFLGFFFVWVIAPLAVIPLLYLGFLLHEPFNRLFERAIGGRRLERRRRLDAEAAARRSQLARTAPKETR